MSEYSLIERKMKLWRDGFSSLPKEYIEYHKKLAENSLEEAKAKGYKIHNTFMELDGWLDEMKVLFAIIESPEGKLLKVHWQDANKRGYWMEKLNCGSRSFKF